jgi:tRNA uridine 5-carbamoylmethylation protein Kti12
MQVQTWAQENLDAPGGSVRIVMPDGKPNDKSMDEAGGDEDLVVHLPSTSSPSFAHLQRLRRQFIALHRQQMGGQGMGSVGQSGGGLQASRIARLFVDWLNDSFAG